MTKPRGFSLISKKLVKAKPGGFTLIELIVVVTIVGIIVSIGSISFGNVQKYNRDQRRKSDLKTIQQSLAGYYSVYRSYPTTGCVMAAAYNTNPCSWWGDHPTYGNHKTDYIPGLAPSFIKSLPLDPNGDQNCRFYLYNSNGYEYKLLSHCPEGTWPTTDPFYDTSRPTWAFQVSSPGAKNW